LLGADGAKGRKQLVVNCPSIVLERTHNALNAFDASLIQGWASVVVREVLFFGSVDDFVMFMWCLLWLDWFGMIVFQKQSGYACVHGKAAGEFGIVPSEIDASKFSPGPVGGDGVMFLEGMQEVFSMSSVSILYAEVINNEYKHDRPPLVTPEAWCGGTLVVPLCFQMFGE
jgi:hypothetical protein